MRGGTANCSVCVSDEPICSPLVSSPGVLIAMNLPSYEKLIDRVAPGGVVILDSSLIDRQVSRTDVTAHYVPATRLAEENGLRSLANLILLGKMMAETAFCSMDTLRAALEKIIPPAKRHLVEKNVRAVALGLGR
jgi:2-oxoglutarate ferredoxin oxidoreductase subunit gamma